MHHLLLLSAGVCDTWLFPKTFHNHSDDGFIITNFTFNVYNGRDANILLIILLITCSVTKIIRGNLIVSNSIKIHITIITRRDIFSRPKNKSFSINFLTR